MQISIPEEFGNTPAGQEANRILRSCVHCGFCTATCPTYRLLGDELDSPRGRIYLIKGLLEGKEVSNKTQLHLDRCLTCRSCETYCPSGVEYGHLLDIGRQKIEAIVTRSIKDRLYRMLLRKILPYRKRFSLLLGLGRLVRPLVPNKFRTMVPKNDNNAIVHQRNTHPRQMILFSGCVQPSLSPNTNSAAINVLDKLDISTITLSNESCCGAIDYHMASTGPAINFIKNNIDLYWPYIENGAEAIVVTASGCGVMVKDYGYILRNDPEYADKAARISTMTRDIAEIIAAEDLEKFRSKTQSKKLAVHNPCTLQHGQKLNGIIEEILEKLGYQLCNVPDKHVCCGSAGVYSLLQAELSQQLRDEKIQALESEQPDIIVTANVGCQLHLQQATDLSVKHWIELLDNL